MPYHTKRLVRLFILISIVSLLLPIRTALAIINGTDVNPDGSGFVLLQSSSGSCSGTLITNEWVLTAKHCLPWKVNASSVTVVMAAQNVGVERIVRHPIADVALIRLQQPFEMHHSTTGYRQAIYAGSTEAILGDTINCSGYGGGQLQTANFPVQAIPNNVDPIRTNLYAAYVLSPTSNGAKIIPGDSGGSCASTLATGETVITGVQSGFWGGTFTQISASIFRDWALYNLQAEALSITNLSAISGESYEIVPNSMRIGAPLYADRDYTYEDMPDFLKGVTRIVTFNDDKFSQEPNFLHFGVNKPVSVYVIYDNRYQRRPTWLSDYSDTGHDVIVEGVGRYSVLEKKFPARPVILGGNYENGEGNNSMYGIAIAEQKLEIIDLSVASGVSYEIVPNGMRNGTPLYADRDYTYEDIPDFLKGTTKISTFNDDKFDQEPNFLRFGVNKPVKVYVIYDNRYQHRPTWLSDYSDTGHDVIVDGVGRYSVLEKQFPAGLVTLGGNYVTGEGNYGMYGIAIAEQKLEIFALSVASGESYEIAPNGMQIGASVYVDRNYTYEYMPGFLKGATKILTFNDDKFDQEPNFLRFSVNKPVRVYVIYDNRYQRRPTWLSDYSDTGHDVIVDGVGRYSVLEKKFQAGPIILGGNYENGEGNNSMYGIAIAEEL